MKKFFLLLLVVAAILPSCTKETPQEPSIKVVPMNIKEVCNINSVEMQILARKGYSPDSAFQVIMPEGTVELVTLKGEDDATIRSSVLMYKNKIIFFQRQIDTAEQYYNTRMTDLTLDKIIWEDKFPTNLNPDEGQKKPCKDRTDSFAGCAKCLINEAHNDAIGVVILFLMPEVMASAIIVHCYKHIGN